MPFTSTRSEACLTASQAILTGLAPDGGLYVPAVFPSVSMEQIGFLANMTYCERASFILCLYLEDYTTQEIDHAVSAAYSVDKFDDPAIAPVCSLDKNTYVLELFHGPTLAFKDMALQLLPHLVTMAGGKNGETREIAILTATSGDTGKAALEGFRDVPGTSCTVFYPKDGVSRVQQLQMTTTAGANTHVIAVEGNFDDAQTGVKKLFGSPDFAAGMDQRGKVLSSANSINFGRLAPQIVYYFSAYADLVHSGEIALGDPVNFVVPTGNFGNILAAYYARNMGLPINKLICASNRNNVLTDFFHTGDYSTNRPFHKTTSPSMDILVSSNLERLLFEAAGRDSATVASWMQQLRDDGHYAVTASQREWMEQIFFAGYADDSDASDEIRICFEQEHYLMDTHTAVAGRVLRRYREQTNDATPSVIVSTANPFKFVADVLSAVTGEDHTADDAFAAAKQLSALTGTAIPQQVSALQTLPVLHTQCYARTDMADAVFAAFENGAAHE